MTGRQADGPAAREAKAHIKGGGISLKFGSYYGLP